MELNHDWKNFHEFFGTARRLNPLKEQVPVGTIHLLTDADRVVFIHCEHEDLSRWAGCTVAEIRSRFEHRQIVALDRRTVEGWLEKSARSSEHFVEQTEHLRLAAGLRKPDEHFLLGTLQGRWGRLLPSSFGLFVELSERDEETRRILLVFKRGALESFLSPDLSSLPADRRQDLQALSKYLSEKYHLPVQCLRTSRSQWRSWQEDARPWRSLRRSVRTQGTRIFPANSGISILSRTLPLFQR